MFYPEPHPSENPGGVTVGLVASDRRVFDRPSTIKEA